jgi:signal transduction histidine kinase
MLASDLTLAKTKAVYMAAVEGPEAPVPARQTRKIITCDPASASEDAVWTIYRESRSLFGRRQFALAVFDRKRAMLDFPLMVIDGRRLDPRAIPFSQCQGLLNDLLSRRTPWLIDDLVLTHYWLRLADTQPTRAWLAVPVPSLDEQDEAPQGFIMVWRDRANAFQPGHIRALSILARLAAPIVQNLRRMKSSPDQVDVLPALTEMSHMLASSYHLDTALRRMMIKMEMVVNLQAAALFLADPAARDLYLRASAGKARLPSEGKPFSLPREMQPVSQVLQSGKAATLTAAQLGQQSRDTLAACLQVDFHRVLCLPVTLYGQVIGVLLLTKNAAEPFTQRDMAFLNMLTAQMATAVATARLHESVLAERGRAMAIEEQVCRQLACNLHDGPAQLVSALIMRVDFCLNALQKAPHMLPSELAEMKALGERAIHEMRTMLVELRPLELEQHGQGLAAALQALIARRQKEVPQTKLRFYVTSPHQDDQVSRLGGRVETTLFMIIQETLNNAIKHAGAGYIAVHLEETSTDIRVEIIDDGRGFDLTQVRETYNGGSSLGLVNIRERAEAIGGDLTMTSLPGQGTTIRVKVPKASADRARKQGTTGLLTLPASHREGT